MVKLHLSSVISTKGAHYCIIDLKDFCTRQSKRPLSVQIVHSRICDNLLSSLYDLNDFCLMTPMTRPKYMRMKIKNLPEEFVTMYNLADKATSNGFVFYIKIQEGMYGLLQAGILTQELLEQRLKKQGYHQKSITPGLWRHE